jgi:hypothetical protein
LSEDTLKKKKTQILLSSIQSDRKQISKIRNTTKIS